MLKPENLTGAGANAAGRPGVDSSGLVSSSISQQDCFQVFPTSLRVKRYGTGNPDQSAPDRSETSINSFSDKSRRRLRFRALNSSPELISQFGLTYHHHWPANGRTSKSHLNAWLTNLRRICPGVGYLWILEFQKRDAPHYHVFLTIPPDDQTRLKLAAAWCRITSPDDPEALRFHSHSKNWIDWDMGSGAYLCKYLDKEAQKCVPDGYINCGRFWGNSRGLEAKPEEICLCDLDLIDDETGEIVSESKTIVRWLGRLAERQTRGLSRFRTRAPYSSYTIIRGASAFNQIRNYFDRPPDYVHRERRR